MIPIPVELAALLFMGFGVFMISGSMVRFATYLVGSNEEEAGWTVTVHHYLGKYFGYNPSQTALASLVGVGFLTFGYLVYFDQLYQLLLYLFSPTQLPLTLVVLIVSAVLLYFLLSTLKERATPTFLLSILEDAKCVLQFPNGKPAVSTEPAAEGCVPMCIRIRLTG